MGHAGGRTPEHGSRIGRVYRETTDEMRLRVVAALEERDQALSRSVRSVDQFLRRRRDDLLVPVTGVRASEPTEDPAADRGAPHRAAGPSVSRGATGPGRRCAEGLAVPDDRLDDLPDNTYRARDRGVGERAHRQASKPAQRTTRDAPATEGAGSGGRGNILVFSQCRISRVDPYHRSGRS